jgi:hypothetical protein
MVESRDVANERLSLKLIMSVNKVEIVPETTNFQFFTNEKTFYQNLTASLSYDNSNGYPGLQPFP